MSANRKKTVLIIDDSNFMRALIRSILSDHGYRVVGEAENGAIGIEKYKDLRPDIVTLDINLDETTGLAVLDLILQHNPVANVLIISSMIGQSTIANEAIFKGAKAVLQKPIEEEALVDALKKID